MAISVASERRLSIDASTHTRRPSLYAAFTVACVLQTLRSRLKSQVDGPRLSENEPTKTSSSYKLGSSQIAKIRSLKQDSFKSGTNPPVIDLPFRSYSVHSDYSANGPEVTSHCSRGMGWSQCSSILLDKLDSCVQLQRVSTATIAADDARFLQYDPTYDLASRNITAIGKILDLTTALINRLQNYSLFTSANKSADILGQIHEADPRCSKTAANLKHMLLCLQYAAVEALTYCYMKVIETEFLHWHSYWQQPWQTGEAWFAEWPGGRRPLNTTWPWNVRPSLLVLWGVCWMFYGNEGVPRTPQAAEFLSESFRTGQPPHLPPHLNPTTTSSSEVWTTSGDTNPQYLIQSQSQPEFSRANRISDYYTLPAFCTSVSSSPYISTSPSTSSASFGTLTDFWPHNQGVNQGINAGSNYTYAPSYGFNVSPRLLNEQTPRSIPALEAARPVIPYAAQYSQAVTNEPRRNVMGAGPGLGQISSEMQGYPSPHSDMSDHRVSPCRSVFPAASTTPVTVPYTTTSRASTTYGSPQSTRSEGPARNEHGLMYCSHTKCAEDPPTFSRKCEWSKHMDKHNRPYVCEERGCEKIQGFTYSGGLLRHQREVHRQHGGPKAPSMCPHKDCKRSTGAGFSRRENLTEHLRRVHRGVGDETTDVLQPKERKRRRVPNDDERKECEEPLEEAKRRKIAEVDDRPKDESEVQGLQAKVEQLERELNDRDGRLRKLEETVLQFQKSPPNL